MDWNGLVDVLVGLALLVRGVSPPVCQGGAAELKRGDWRQFMRDSEHTGDASGEILEMPLSLTARVKLDDAVLTSPAVVGGRAYVVDQMGSAYCIDPDARRVLWKTTPEGDSAFGSNTSSPCIVDGRMIFGTTSGKLHFLDVRTGAMIKSLTFGRPIVSGITARGSSLYVQTLDATVHCVTADGQIRWKWNQNLRYENGSTPNRPPALHPKRYHTAYKKPQYGGLPVTVSGKRVIVPVGFDLVCLEDRGTEPKLSWTQPGPDSKPSGPAVPMGSAIVGGFVYVGMPGSDGAGWVRRNSLSTGASKKSDRVSGQWAVFATPAVRGSTVYYSRHAFGVSAYDFDRRKLLWSTFRPAREELTPSVSSPVLSRNHCIFTTLHGELIAVDLKSRGSGLNRLDVRPFRFRTPHGRPITSSPAVAGGRVFFGCDDGHLYVLGKGPAVQAAKEDPFVHRRKSVTTPAGKRRTSWPSAFGGPGNTNFVDDESVKPPFRLRWAARSLGCFKQPMVASEEDVISLSLSGMVAAREQTTGRLRWRTKLPGQAWSRGTLLHAAGKVFIPQTFSPRYPKVADQNTALYCLDGDSGGILWKASLKGGGVSDRLRASPVHVDGVVAMGYLDRKAGGVHRVQAWKTDTGSPLWEVELKSSGSSLEGPSGCAGNGVMIFTGGGNGSKGTGETVAIEPASGRILWRTGKAWASQTGTPSLQEGRLYLPGAYKLPMTCLSAEDGSVVWRRPPSRWAVDVMALGPGYGTVNNKYPSQGGALRIDLSDGKLMEREEGPIQLFGAGHGCGSVVLLSGGYALSATDIGLFVTDSRTGKLLWKSLGFAPKSCPHPIVSNGRIFYSPQVNGMTYCFEPIEGE